MKLKRKRTCFNQDDLYEKRMYLQCFHYRTTDYLQKKFQDESSVLKAKQLLETLHMAEERDFRHGDAEVHRVIKMPPPPPPPPPKKKNINNRLQNFYFGISTTFVYFSLIPL